jgi:flagellar assembly protein FliH
VPTVSSNHGSPKDKFPAWERWNPGALHTEQPQERRVQPSQEATESRAYAEGFEQGRQAGLQAGYNEGRALASTEAAQIHVVAQAAQAALHALGDTLARKTVALAAAIAQKIMQREIQSCPASVLDIVRDALTLLPDGEQRVRIVVNRADLALVRDALTQEASLPEGVVAGSDDVARGGCRIVSPSGEIDATLQTRIKRVLEALGVPDSQSDQPLLTP